MAGMDSSGQSKKRVFESDSAEQFLTDLENSSRNIVNKKHYTPLDAKRQRKYIKKTDSNVDKVYDNKEKGNFDISEKILYKYRNELNSSLPEPTTPKSKRKASKDGSPTPVLPSSPQLPPTPSPLKRKSNALEFDLLLENELNIDMIPPSTKPKVKSTTSPQSKSNHKIAFKSPPLPSLTKESSNSPSMIEETSIPKPKSRTSARTKTRGTKSSPKQIPRSKSIPKDEDNSSINLKKEKQMSILRRLNVPSDSELAAEVETFQSLSLDEKLTTLFVGIAEIQYLLKFVK